MQEAQTTTESGMIAGDAHQWLGTLIGEWSGMARTWFEPDKLADTSPIRGTIKPFLGGRFVMHEYEGTLVGESMVGMAIYGYHKNRKQFEMSWVDSCHTGTQILFSDGIGNDGAFAVMGHYPDGVGGPDWGWRTEITVVDADHITITMYNITPTGEEAKGVEIEYTREK